MHRYWTTIALRLLTVTLAGLGLSGWLAACVAVPPMPLVEGGSADRQVHVVSNGWHTTIVLPRRDLVAVGALPEAGDIPAAEFLEFGWGERTYYMAEEPTFGMALKAALVPSSSVIHMAGLSLAPTEAYPGSETILVKLTQAEFERLVRAISDVFSRSQGVRARPIAPGHLPVSHFYDAYGEFHLFNTCNTWTARMLQAAGLRLSPSGIVTATELMTRLREATRDRKRANLIPATTANRRIASRRRKWQPPIAAAGDVAIASHLQQFTLQYQRMKN